MINGIELSAKCCGKSVHMLGYGFDKTNTTFQNILEEQRQQREERLYSIVHKFKSIGINVTAKDVLQFVDGGSIGRPHAAKALLEKGYVNSIDEAFHKYLGEGKPCYVEKSKELSPEYAITIIKEAGGLANLDSEIKKWIQFHHLDGLEVYHRDHTQETIRHYESLIEKWESLSDKPLLKTGGSDFHHETYGRHIEPIGGTTISATLAEKVIQRSC